MCHKNLQMSLREFKWNITFFVASLYVSVFTFQFRVKNNKNFIKLVELESNIAEMNVIHRITSSIFICREIFQWVPANFLYNFWG